jgi:hypothetical protein
MLGAVKDDPGAENIPLFRLLARRWKSFAPAERERRVALSRSRDDEPKQTRAWIEKPRVAIYANAKIEQKISKRAWNPWLWIK